MIDFGDFCVFVVLSSLWASMGLLICLKMDIIDYPTTPKQYVFQIIIGGPVFACIFLYDFLMNDVLEKVKKWYNT